MSNKAEEKYCISPIVRNNKNFIYKGKKYPINFDSVKNNSLYFYSNCDKFTEENIELQENIEITEFTIETFINCCENKEFTVNESNVFQLNYLSKKYEVPELTKITQDFIGRPNAKLAFESLHFKIQLQDNCKTLSNQDIQFFNTSNEEEIISNRLNEYLNDERLLDVPIPIIDRILKKYVKANKEKENFKEIIEFLFKYLDKHRTKASILFLNIDIDNQPKDLLIRLLTDYGEIFDFNMINLKSILKTTSELTKELIKIKEEYDERINEMKQIIIEQKEEIRQFNESRTLIDKDFKSFIEEQKKIISEQKKEIDIINNSIETKFKTYIEEQKQKNEEQNQKINRFNEEKMNELNKIIEEQKNEIRKINEEQNKRINLLNSDQNQKINRVVDEQNNIISKLQSVVSIQQVKDEINNQTKQFITKEISIHNFYRISVFVFFVVFFSL